MKKNSILKVLVVAIALAPSMVYAQSAVPTPVQNFGDIVHFIDQASQWFFGFILALAVIYLLYAAFLYLTAAGDEKKTGDAKNIIIYAIIGIVVALIAGGITSIVTSFFG
ncbi:MAG: hypothetical protein V1652_04110 [bacterium]